MACFWKRATQGGYEFLLFCICFVMVFVSAELRLLGILGGFAPQVDALDLCFAMVLGGRGWAGIPLD